MFPVRSPIRNGLHQGRAAATRHCFRTPECAAVWPTPWPLAEKNSLLRQRRCRASSAGREGVVVVASRSRAQAEAAAARPTKRAGSVRRQRDGLLSALARDTERTARRVAERARSAGASRFGLRQLLRSSRAPRLTTPPRSGASSSESATCNAGRGPLRQKRDSRRSRGRACEARAGAPSPSEGERGSDRQRSGLAGLAPHLAGQARQFRHSTGSARTPKRPRHTSRRGQVMGNGPFSGPTIGSIAMLQSIFV